MASTATNDAPSDRIPSLQHTISSRPASYSNTQLVGSQAVRILLHSCSCHTICQHSLQKRAPMESHLPISPTKTRCSPPKDFVREDMKPAPLRLSPKSKEIGEVSGVSQQQPGTGFIKSATPTDEATTTKRATDKLPIHQIQLKNPPLAAIVSKFEILDVMTDLEKQATTSHGALSVEVSRLPARNSVVHKELGVCIKSGLAKESPPGLGSEEVGELQSTPSPSEISPRRSSSCEPQSTSQTGIQPAVVQTAYFFDPFTGERRPDKPGGSADGRQRSLVAERRQMFEAPIGKFDTQGNAGLPGMLTTCIDGVRKSLPLPIPGKNGVMPQTPTPTYTLPRTKTWKTRLSDIETPQDSSRARAEPPLDPRPVNADEQPKAAVEGGWTRSISKSLGYSAGQRTRPTREKTQREYTTASKGQRDRGKLFGLWPRAMDALHSRDASTSDSEQVATKAPDRPMDQVALETTQSVSRNSTRLSVPQSETFESQEKPNSGHATSIIMLPESSGNAATVTAQSKVASLRRLFDKSANDTGPKSGSRLRRSHTGPTKRSSAHGNSRTALRSGHEQQVQYEVSTDGAISRSPQSMAGAHVSKESTSSSLKDRINTLEAICRIDEEMRPSTNKMILAPRSKTAGPEREADSPKIHPETRFESLGFKRGREVWRKISASWEKGRLEEGKRDGNDHTKQKVAKSPEPPTWQGSYLTAARSDDKHLAKCSPEEPSTRSLAACASASTRDSPLRKSTSAIPRECLSTGASLDGCSAEEKGALPLSTTGPVAASNWWQLVSSSSHAPWKTTWEALSGDAHGISWGRWRTPRDRGIVAAGAKCRMHHPRPLPTVQLGKTRKAATRQSGTNISSSN